MYKKSFRLFLAFFCSSFLAEAQVLQTENFNSLTQGVVGTNIIGDTPGQGGWYTLIQQGGTNDSPGNFSVIDAGGEYGQVLQITGSDTDSGIRAIWKEGLSDAWNQREEENNTIEVEFDFYTGAVSNSKSSFSLEVYDQSLSKILVGFNMPFNTKQVRTIAYYNPNDASIGGVDNYFFQLQNTDGTFVTLPVNTWVNIRMTYNKITGIVTVVGQGFDFEVEGAITEADPYRAAFIMTPETGNTSAVTAIVDNYRTQAVGSESIGLGIDEIRISNLLVYPNPVRNILTIDTGGQYFNNINILDINGRKVKNICGSKISLIQVDMSDLTNGVYFINAESDRGNSTVRVIKN